MKVGILREDEVAEIANREGLAYADALYGLAVEELISHLQSSPFAEWVWYGNAQIFSKAGYESKHHHGICLIYTVSNKKIPEEKLIPGQQASIKLMEVIADQLIKKEAKDLFNWKLDKLTEDGAFRCSLLGTYLDMKVPISIVITSVLAEEVHPFRSKLILMGSKREISLLCYGLENNLAENFYEIMKMLELIKDMEAYQVVYEILKNESISGRHIMEILADLSAKEPKVLRLKRIDQLKEYRSYAYMKKRWQQYLRGKKKEMVPWEEVIDLIVVFAEPIWKSLCENEIFFDDWMPELGRFLG